MATTTYHDWQVATLDGENLRFSSPGGLTRALADGFFFVKAPAGFDTSAGDRFARSFYLPQGADPYCGFASWTPDKLDVHEGYYSRDADQTEQFFLEARFWKEVYPEALVAQAAAMRDFALGILRAVLSSLEFPPELWDEATGRCLSSRGMYHLTFNHFRPNVRSRGLNTHKDSGWVTLLRSIEPGLEVLRNGTWCPIVPMPGYFIVNFGCAMEILTQHTATPVAAVAHRVLETPLVPGKADRFSYALFVDSSLDETVCPGLFRYRAETGLELEMSFKTFLDQILTKTYQEGTVGLY